jgi:heme exporter protein A
VELRAHELACERGGRLVFRSVSFSVASGQLLQLTGPNGSGKSTLLRVISGLCDIAEGSLALDGGHEELTIGQQCHYAAHLDAIKPALTVSENLRFWSDFLGGGNVEGALTAFDLKSLETYPAALLSAGQRHRLSLSRLALIPRAVWLLDEPTVGLDASSLEKLGGLIRGHLASGGIAIAATHVPLPVPATAALDLGAAP